MESVPLDHAVRPPRLHLTRPAADPGHTRCGGGVSGRARPQTQAGRADGVDGRSTAESKVRREAGPSRIVRRWDNETAKQPHRASAPSANPKHLPPARHGTRERGARGASRRTRIAPVPADPRECLWRHRSRRPGRRADDRVRGKAVAAHRRAARSERAKAMAGSTPAARRMRSSAGTIARAQCSQVSSVGKPLLEYA